MLLSRQDSAVMKYRGGSVDDRFIDYNVIIIIMFIVGPRLIKSIILGPTFIIKPLTPIG